MILLIGFQIGKEKRKFHQFWFQMIFTLILEKEQNLQLKNCSKHSKLKTKLKLQEIILQKGDLNLTTDQRRKMIEEKKKQIVEYIAKTYVDPKTHLPHPPLRIEQAMKDGRVSVDPQKSVDEQVKDIVEKLRSIIALKSENLQLEIVIPAQYASQSYAVLKSVGSLKKEEWQNNGSLKAILEIPAAARPNVIDRLGSITKGSATVEVMQ